MDSLRLARDTVPHRVAMAGRLASRVPRLRRSSAWLAAACARLEKERCRENADHRERNADLDGGADREANPRGDASLARLLPVPLDAQLAQHCSDERPDD